MKNKLKEILSNRNMKIIIPSIVLFVLFIVLFIYFQVNKYNNYRDKQEQEVYQYIGGQRYEYDAIISFNRKKVIKNFETDDYVINYSSVPIYYEKEEIEQEELEVETKEEKEQIVIFPSMMNIVFPLIDKAQQSIPEFSYIKNEKGYNFLTFEDYSNRAEHYFLHDGNDLYFFSDSVTFEINGEEITLSPLSYIVDSTVTFEYYDYATDTFTQVVTDESVVVYNEYYKINVSNDYVDFSGKKMALFSRLNELSPLK